MAILLLSADADAVRAWLLADGHKVVSVALADEAVARAGDPEIALVLTDVRPAGLDADFLRMRMRSARGPRPLPFVFLSSGDADADVLARLGSAHEPLRVYPRPLDLERLVETIGRVLSESVNDGNLREGSLVKRLETIAFGRASGVLTVSRDAFVKQFVFRDGGLAFCAASDPSELVSQLFLKLGIASEDELRGQIGVEELLEKARKITGGRVPTSLARKFRETILDAFIWDDGIWTWKESTVGADLETLDLPPIIGQGQRRAARWTNLRSMLPDDGVTFQLFPPKFPPGFPSAASDRRLVELAAAGKTLAQIREELPGQDFGIYSRFADFGQMGIVRIADGSAEIVAPALPDIPTLLDRASDALFAEDPALASVLFGQVLAVEPWNTLAKDGLAMLEKAAQNQEEQDASREQEEKARAEIERRAWEGMSALDRGAREQAEREAEARAAEERRIAQRAAMHLEEVGRRLREEEKEREKLEEIKRKQAARQSSAPAPEVVPVRQPSPAPRPELVPVSEPEPLPLSNPIVRTAPKKEKSSLAGVLIAIGGVLAIGVVGVTFLGGPPPAVVVAPVPSPTPTAVPSATPELVIELVKKPTVVDKRAQADALVEDGQARLDGGNPAGAAKLFRQALALDAENASAHLGLGTSVMMQGDEAGARKSFRAFLELAPDDPRAPLVRQLLQQ